MQPTAALTANRRRVGAFVLDLHTRELRNGPISVRLQDQPFAALCLLLERPGDIVTRGELHRRLWPAGTFVDFEHSLNAAIKRLRAALRDDAMRPTFIETVPRRGYRFIAATDDERIEREAVIRRRLVVLPFNSYSTDLDVECFCDGLTEELMVQLEGVREREFEIIARSSSMFYKHCVQRARDIGEALQAGYLLEGSARYAASRVRITARLIDAATEAHVWSDTYEHVLTETLAVQADVAGRVARSIVIALGAGVDGSRLTPPLLDSSPTG